MTCGSSRILISLLDAHNKVVSAPDRTASVAFYDLAKDPNTPVTAAEGTFVWTIQDERGMYIVDVDLPEAGTWGAEFTTAGRRCGPRDDPLTFDVLVARPTVKVGDPAPASKTPTLADVGGDATKISTDADPRSRPSTRPPSPTRSPRTSRSSSSSRPRSSASAPNAARRSTSSSRSPRPTRRSRSSTSSRTSSRTSTASSSRSSDAGGALQNTATTNEWGLTAEPWIFAVDGSGVVRGSYELIASEAEIDEAITEITKGS